jgi:large subunit ribosomal protein L22
MATAFLKHYRQSPRKVRLVADMVRGKKATDAIDWLTFTPRKSALPLKKLISSAMANAANVDGAKPEDLVISEIRVDKGLIMYRNRARARGRGAPLRKRTCHVLVTVESIAPPAEKEDAKKAPAKKAEKKDAEATAKTPITKKSPSVKK